MKTLDLRHSVHDLVNQYPDLKDILHGLGFTEITNSMMLDSVGRIMTIPKGAGLKQIDMTAVVQTLQDHGFEVTGLTRAETQTEPAEAEHRIPAEKQPAQAEDRIALLKDYLARLKSGEDLAQVQEEFVKNFQDVDAAEIMRAEQELMAEGTPLQEVQRLCDVHSALFHGLTRAEKIANAEAAVRRSLAAGSGQDRPVMSRKEMAARLEDIEGHPLQTFTRENQALDQLMDTFRETRRASVLSEIRDLAVHYAKKGDLLYPLLKVNYGISGPSDVMWTVDDEIRDELAKLDQVPVQDRGADWEIRVDAILQRAKEMIYKEQNILYPIAAQHFTEQDWQQIYQDSRQYPPIFGLPRLMWEAGESFTRPDAPVLSQGVIRIPGGSLSLPELTAMLDTIPMELTFVDGHDINRYFNDGPDMKAFKRPLAALGREVYSCHPPKIEPMVRHIIQEFKNGTRDEVAVWVEKAGRPMYVRYMAVRSKTGDYLGTLEAVQDMTFAKEHFQHAQ